VTLGDGSVMPWAALVMPTLGQGFGPDAAELVGATPPGRFEAGLVGQRVRQNSLSQPTAGLRAPSIMTATKGHSEATVRRGD